MKAYHYRNPKITKEDSKRDNRSKRTMKVLVTQSCPTLCKPRTVPARLLCPWNSPSKNTGMGCHSLLQGIFQTQGLNVGLLQYRQVFYHLTYHGRQYKEL